MRMKKTIKWVSNCDIRYDCIIFSSQSSDSALLLDYHPKIFSFHFQDQNKLVELTNNRVFWLILGKGPFSSDIINQPQI